jgi:hypothetical protein
MKCKNCNKDIANESKHYPIVKESGHCFDCWFWIGEVLNSKIPHFRIKDTVFAFGIRQIPGKWNGYGGTWHFYELPTGEKVKSCDVWHRGSPPPEFLDRFTELKPVSYSEARNNSEFIEWNTLPDELKFTLIPAYFVKIS